MNNEQVAAFLEVMAEIEEYRPVIKMVIEKLESFGPDVKNFLTKLSVGAADIQSETFFRYIEKGLSREEALALVLNQNLTIYNALNKK